MEGIVGGMFQGAWRHSQGVAELGYVMLGYLRLLAGGFTGPSIRVRRGILRILAKTFIIHIVSVLAYSVVVPWSLVAVVGSTAPVAFREQTWKRTILTNSSE